MIEQLITFETAKSAKEKGFNIFCNYVFDLQEESHTIEHNADYLHKKSLNWIFRPTQALLQKYLREVHNILVDVVTFYDIDKLPLNKYNLQKPKGYFYWNYYDETFNEEGAIKFDTYEEALEYGLQEALKLI